MIIDYDPDDYESIIEHHICSFHKKHPGVPYAGCTCFSSYSQRRKDNKSIKNKILAHMILNRKENK